MALTTSSDPRCHQCRVPFSSQTMEGVGGYTCNAFVDSLVKPANSKVGDVNKAVKCDLCEDEDGTMFCVECNQNLCAGCSRGHKRGRSSASHHIVTLKGALTGTTALPRIPRCQKHVGYEVNTYCKTCNDAVCAMCAVEKHSGHTFCPLIEVTGPLQDQIAGYTITITKREEEARKAVATLDGSINKIEEYCSAAEEKIATLFASIRTVVDAREAEIIGEMQTKGDQLRKTAILEKGDAESATVQFREFRTFTEGLLAQGTPLVIAGTHQMVRSCLWFFFVGLCSPSLFLFRSTPEMRPLRTFSILHNPQCPPRSSSPLAKWMR